MSVISNDQPVINAPCKAELLRAMTRRYPALDTGTIMVVSQIQSIARLLSARLNNDLAVYGLTEGKFYVLGFLTGEELAGREHPSPSDIAAHLDITRGTVTGLLDGLEREDYIVRCHDKHDRRALTIQMTDKAREFLDSFLPTCSTSLAQSLPLTDAEKGTLVEWLSRVEQPLRNSIQSD